MIFDLQYLVVLHRPYKVLLQQLDRINQSAEDASSDHEMGLIIAHPVV